MRLILLFLPLSFFTKADMDYVCYVDENNAPYKFIAENCQRNNVLVYTSTHHTKTKSFIFQIFVGLIEMLKEIKPLLPVFYMTKNLAVTFILINSSRKIYHQIQGT